MDVCVLKLAVDRISMAIRVTSFGFKTWFLSGWSHGQGLDEHKEEQLQLTTHCFYISLVPLLFSSIVSWLRNWAEKLASAMNWCSPLYLWWMISWSATMQPGTLVQKSCHGADSHSCAILPSAHLLFPPPPTSCIQSNSSAHRFSVYLLFMYFPALDTVSDV